MLSFDPTNRTERENYKLLTGSVIPRPIAFVTTITKNGTINGAPFSYFNIVSAEPPMISLGIQRRDGEPKDTTKNMMDHQAFVVHIVDETIVDKINETAATLAPDESEIELAGLTPADSADIPVPGIREAKIRFECILEKHIELEGESLNGTDLMIGKIVRYHIAEELYEDGKVNQKKLQAVSRLAGSNYATTGDVFSLQRPK